MKIQNARSVAENKIKAVIYGLSGAGKTSLLKTLPPAGFKPLGLSLESGMLAIGGNDIDYIDLTKDDAGLPLKKHEKLNRLMQSYQYVLTEECKKKYDTIFIDSLSEVSGVMFDAIRNEYPENKDTLMAYGLLAQKTKDFLRAMRDIPNYHVVFVCLSKTEKDESGKRYAAPEMLGSISDKLAGFVDEFLYLRVNAEGQRELVCDSSDAIIAKDRSGKLSKIEPADLGAIFNKILQQPKQEGTK